MKKADGSRRRVRRDHRRGRSAKNDVVAVKSLRGARRRSQQQASVPFDEAVDYIVDQIIGGHDHDHDHDHVHYHP